jgi:iron complex outermembrane receptor protein
MGQLSVAVDRFSIEVNDQVTQIGEQEILDLCYLSPAFPAEPFCAFVDRDASNRLTVFDNYVNIATQISEGYDYDLRYLHSLMGGTLTLDFSMTQYLEQKDKLFETDPFDDDNGQVSLPEVTADFYAEFDRGPWTLRWGLTWIQEMSNHAANEDDPSTSFFVLHTPDVTMHNASVQYRQDAWEFTAGVRNLTDEQPPAYSAIDGFANRIGSTVLYSGFEPLYAGRQFFVNLARRF